MFYHFHFRKIIQKTRLLVQNLDQLSNLNAHMFLDQDDDHVKMTFTSQLINSISRVFQELLKYFNGTIISTPFVFPSAGVFPVILILDLNHSECVNVSFASSL